MTKADETPLDRRDRVKAALGTGPEGYTADALRRIANGPIMDANRIYLPAGKCSLDEVRRREAVSVASEIVTNKNR